jgi:N-acetylglutamate synthase-like GNAT family acetyltransferase
MSVELESMESHPMTRHSTTGAELRSAAPEDLPAIELLLTLSGLPVEGVADSVGNFVVAESEGSIVGVIGLEVHDGHGLLRSVAVDPEWRGAGLGQRLVARIIAEAEARGFRALYLLTTTADRYFPKFGFTTAARSDIPEALHASAELRGACPASARVMQLCITRASADAPG